MVPIEMMTEGISNRMTSVITKEIRKDIIIEKITPPDIIIFSLKSVFLVPTIANKRITASKPSLNVTTDDVNNSSIYCYECGVLDFPIPSLNLSTIALASLATFSSVILSLATSNTFNAVMKSVIIIF